MTSLTGRAMKSPECHKSDKTRGFTLLEFLLAGTIFLIVLMIFFSVVHVWHRQVKEFTRDTGLAREILPALSYFLEALTPESLSDVSVPWPCLTVEENPDGILTWYRSSGQVDGFLQTSYEGRSHRLKVSRGVVTPKKREGVYVIVDRRGQNCAVVHGSIETDYLKVKQVDRFWGREIGQGSMIIAVKEFGFRIYRRRLWRLVHHHRIPLLSADIECARNHAVFRCESILSSPIRKTHRFTWVISAPPVFP